MAKGSPKLAASADRPDAQDVCNGIGGQRAPKICSEQCSQQCNDDKRRRQLQLNRHSTTYMMHSRQKARQQAWMRHNNLHDIDTSQSHPHSCNCCRTSTTITTGGIQPHTYNSTAHVVDETNDNDKTVGNTAAANVVLEQNVNEMRGIGRQVSTVFQYSTQPHAQHYTTHDTGDVGGSSAIQMAADGFRAPKLEPSPSGGSPSLGQFLQHHQLPHDRRPIAEASNSLEGGSA